MSKSSSFHQSDTQKRKKTKKSHLQNLKRYKRGIKQNNEINPLYQSQVSEMWSEISIPQAAGRKINKQQLIILYQKIINEVLTLREQKIIALENLNKITDKKNRAIELIRSYAMKETSRLSQNHIQMQGHEKDKLLSPKSNNLSSSSIHESAKISQQIDNRANALNEASKIRQELMKPLQEHPLLIKNRQLKAELEIMQQEFTNKNTSTSRIQNQIQYYRTQNVQLESEIRKQKEKLSRIHKNRFETFFPQDRKKVDEINSLIFKQQELINKKLILTHQLMNGTIIRKAEDQIYIEELKDQNRRLLEGCQHMLRNRFSQQQQFPNKFSDSIEYKTQLYSLSVEELQSMVYNEYSNKTTFMQTLGEFKHKITELQNENYSLKANAPRISYYY